MDIKLVLLISATINDHFNIFLRTKKNKTELIKNRKRLNELPS